MNWAALRPARKAPAALWLPGLLAVALTFIPVFYLALRSTEDGWSPWSRAFHTSVPQLLQRSLWLAAVVALFCVAVAVPAAWLTTRADIPARRVWSVLLTVPLAIPSYITALAVVAFLGPKGMLQGWLEPLGVDRLPEVYGFWGAAFTLTCAGYPYVYLVVRAALASADTAEEEASRSLGVSPLRTFFAITLPGLVPALAAGILLSVLYTLSDFGAVSLLNYSTFTRDIFIEYQSSFDLQHRRRRPRCHSRARHASHPHLRTRRALLASTWAQTAAGGGAPRPPRPLGSPRTRVSLDRR